MDLNIIIRKENKADYRAVENLAREAFWNVYQPGCVEQYLLHYMRDKKEFIPELAFVMEKDGAIIGQNVFAHAEIACDDGRVLPILTMGPICISPEYKRKGLGKKLLDYSLEKAKELGYGAVCIEGNIDFYGKSGFLYARNFGLRYHGLPEGADDSFFLCNELKEGYLKNVTGEYSTPACYMIDPSDAEEFDKGFPYKEKLKLEGQIF